MTYDVRREGGQRAPAGGSLADAVHRPARRVRGPCPAVGRGGGRRLAVRAAGQRRRGDRQVAPADGGDADARGARASARATTRRRACTPSAAYSSRPAGSGRPWTRGWPVCALAGNRCRCSPSIPTELIAPPPEVDLLMLRVRALHVAAGIIAATTAVAAAGRGSDRADESTLDLLARRAPGVPTARSTARDDFERRGRCAASLLGCCRPASWRRWPVRSPRKRLSGPKTSCRTSSPSDGVPRVLEELHVRLAASCRRACAGLNPAAARGAARPGPARSPWRRSRPRADRLHDRARRRPRAAAAGGRAERRDVRRQAGQPDGQRPARPHGRPDRPLPARADPRRGLRDPARVACRERHSRIADLLPAVAVPASDAGVAAFHSSGPSAFRRRSPPTSTPPGPARRWAPTRRSRRSSRTC